MNNNHILQFYRWSKSTGIWFKPGTSIRIIFLVLLMAVCGYASATNYYFAASGDDLKNSGLSIQSPLKSLEKLNKIMAMLNPGDSVLFRRGDVFDGGLRITRSGDFKSVIYFGAYGNGSKPVLNGTKKISDWKKIGFNKWETIFNTNIGRFTNLFINGVQQPLGRWPNITESDQGYLSVHWASGENRLSSKSIPDGRQWLGADIVIKTKQWVLDRITISSASGDTLTLQSKTSYEINSQFGFFINNHPSTLDQNGEWCFEKETGKITLYSETDPTSSIIEVSDIQDMISIREQSFIKIENLVLNGSVNNAIISANSKNITIRNTEIVHAGLYGVMFTNCRNTVFEYNEVNNVNNQGLIFDNCYGTVIRRNEIKNIGLIPGMGTNGSNAHNALEVTGSCNLIEHNKIDSIGYIALRFNGDSVTIRHNVISKYCMVKNDGGGIYTWENGEKAPSIKRKIIGNIIHHSPEDAGIYIDDRCANVEIIGNTVYKCGGIGIFIHNSNHVMVRNNLVFDNRVQLQMLTNKKLHFPVRNCTIKNNIFVSRTPEQKIGHFLTDEEINDLKCMGELDSNYYCSPASPMIMFCSYKSGFAEVSLADWKKRFGYDQYSLPAPVHYSYTINSLDTLQNITYGFYHDGEDTWYHEKSTGEAALKNIKTDLTGTPNNLQKGMNKNLVLAMNINFKEGEEQKYLLRFDTKGEKPGEIKVNFKTRDHLIKHSMIFKLSQTFQTNEMLYIPTYANISYERVNFEFGDPQSAVWIKNISFRKADVTIPDPEDHFLFLANELEVPQSFPVEKGFVDISGKTPENTVILQPFSSCIFFK